MKKVGIYPGTFDPIHPGHIAFALEAARLCQLDAVFFLPDHIPPAKNSVSSYNSRCLMIQASITGLSNLKLLKLAKHRFSVSKTLPILQQHFIGANLTFLIGSDVAEQLAKWPGIEELVQSVNFAIGMRENSNTKQIKSQLSILGARLTIVRTDQAHISSSQYRT